MQSASGHEADALQQIDIQRAKKPKTSAPNKRPLGTPWTDWLLTIKRLTAEKTAAANTANVDAQH